MKIIAIVHIYYPEMWNELKECLKNIYIPYDLIVTFVAQHEVIENDIIKFKSDAKIMHVANFGYDVGPFFQALQTVDLDDYDLLVKLHTKRNLNFQYPPSRLSYYKVAFSGWRKMLLSFIADKNNLKKCIEAFECIPELGMVNNYKLLIDDKKEGDKQVLDDVKKWLAENEFVINSFQYVAGTMFIARASLFKILQKSTFQFNKTDRFDFHSNAHVLERIFGAIVYAQGKYIADVFSEKQHPSKKEIFMFSLQTFFRFLLQIKITTSKKILIKIFKIPVFRKQLTQKQIDNINKAAIKLLGNKNEC